MGYFLLGVAVGWVIEWLLYQFWWKPKHPVSSASHSTDFSQERKKFTEKIGDKDAEITHLKARIAILEDRGPASKAVKPSAPAKEKPAPVAKKPEPKKAAAKPKTAAKPKSVKADDLKKVSGIGPKIAELLKAEGVDSFAKLAKTDLEKIQTVLKNAGPRYALADASSWPEQAQLLDDGKLDALELLQASLKK